MSETDWRMGLQIGHTVIVRTMFGDDCLGTVERLTPTQIITKGGTRFWRKSGAEVGGDGYHTSHLDQPSPARVAAIRRTAAIKKLGAVRWARMPDAVLAEVLRLLPVEFR